ncbi:MAG TPA: ABC transporter ATP-binding protein [Acidimicrobiales bacterium]|nr:ABC transporter ATP-binding protein [Acidimicrobiales bacterium]
MTLPATARGAGTGDRAGKLAAAASAESVSKCHGTGPTAVLALDDVSVRFPAGTFTAVTGPSGSGKSTLLHCLAGLDRPTSGRIVLGDVDLTGLGDRQLTRLRRDRVGFVFQAFNLVPTLTARENIVLPLEIAGRTADPEWLQELVATLSIGDRLAHRPDELSGGEQQRVAVARALVSRPDVVFADEPTGNLDSRAGHDLLSLIAEAVERYHQTVVMVTHDAGVAARAGRVVFLVDGKVADDLSCPTATSVHERMQALWG